MASSTLIASWEAAAVSRCVNIITYRLHRLPAGNRPSNADSLRNFAKVTCRNRVCLYAFDPRDVVKDLEQRGLATAELAAQLMELLQDITPTSGIQPAPRADWPVSSCYGWTKPPSGLQTRAFAIWICDRAHVGVRVDVEEVLKTLIGSEKICETSTDGKLLYKGITYGPEDAAIDTWAEPWNLQLAPAKIPRSDVTVQAALLIQLPSLNPAYATVQEIRQKHDPAYERWMPHINIFYPFVRIEKLSTPVLQRRLRQTGVHPFELHLDDVHSFSHIGNYHLAPSSESEKELQKLHEYLLDALPDPPNGLKWGEAAQTKGKGKGAGKGKNDELETFKPHMTIAKIAPYATPPGFKGFKDVIPADGVRFMVDHVDICERGDETPFKVVATLKLSQD